MKTHIWFLALIILQLNSKAQNKNGFDISNSILPKSEIKGGGPPKDGIPSIDLPNFLNTQESPLSPQDRVLGVYLNGIAKAYPIKILNYHEIVNDYFNEKPVVITYCPLCGSGLAFDAKIKNKPATFGVSGLLYNSDVLLYDRETESLWSQLLYRAVSGPMVGASLQIIPIEMTTWKDWKESYPNTLVLSEETGFYRNYNQNPYPGYDTSSQLYFSVNHTDDRFQAKETIIGIEIGHTFKAYPFSELEKVGDSILMDTLQGKTLKIKYSSTSKSAVILDLQDNILPSVTSFWFAWMAFHPDSEVYFLKQK